MDMRKPQQHHGHESRLFFNTDRILRWMRWHNRRNNPHPELTAFEQELHRQSEATRKRGLLRKVLRMRA
jgi:hypothetical protein